MLFLYITTGDQQLIIESLLNLLPAFLLCLVLAFLFTMAFIFAPLLVGWQQVSVLEAYKLSFFSCLKNWRALSVNGGIWLLLGFGIGLVMAIIVGVMLALPKLLGITIFFVLYLVLVLVMFPIGCANTYYSYKMIFQQEDEIPEK